MAIQDDFTIDYTNKRIYHSSGTTVYAVNAFYSWLMDQFDELTDMDDTVPMEAPSAQQYKLINGWFVPFGDMQYLTGDNSGTKDGGSIETSGHARVVSSNAGIVKVQRTGSNIVAGDIGNAITHADGDSGVLLDVSGSYLFIRPDSSAAGDNWDSTSGNITCNGHVDVQAAAAASGESLWTNFYSIGSDLDISSITLYLEQNGAAIAVSDISYGYTTGHIDLLILVKDTGTVIDSGEVTILAREWGYTYDYYVADLSNGGRLPAPIATAADANNQTALGTVAAYSITVSHGSYTEDVDQSGSAENYEARIDLASTHTVAEAYEYTKYITRRGATGTVDGVQGQLYKAADATYAVVKANPFGSFAGGKFFGARGVYFLLSARPASQANLYELIDSDGNGPITEPTSVTVQVTSVIAGDRVLVALSSAGEVDQAQYTTAASGNSATSSTVTLTASANGDTPSSGIIRLQGKRYQYSSVSGAVFTLDATAHPTGLDEDNNSVNAYVPWLDEEAAGTTASVGVSYAADRDVIIRVRKKGIVPFQNTGQITTGGLSVSAIRTVDGVVT